VDHAVQTMLIKAEKRAADTIEQHRKELDRLVDALEKKETLAREDIEQCLGPASVKKQLSSVPH